MGNLIYMKYVFKITFDELGIGKFRMGADNRII